LGILPSGRVKGVHLKCIPSASGQGKHFYLLEDEELREFRATNQIDLPVVFLFEMDKPPIAPHARVIF